MSRPLPSSFEAALVHELLLQDEVLEGFWAHARLAPPMTLSLITACVLAHVGTGWLDQTLRGPRAASWLGGRGLDALVAAGARSRALIEDQGEAWRMLSCVFLHGDLVHLSVNLLALYALGRICEALYGPARLLALFLLTGLGGSLLSHAGGTPNSVGASGAVFGLLGLGLAFGLRHHEVLPRSLRKALGRGLLPWILLNLFLGLALLPKELVREALGFTPPSIDVLGHLGGLAVGFVVGLGLRSRAVPWEAPSPRLGGLALGLSVAALAWALWGVWGSLAVALGG